MILLTTVLLRITIAFLILCFQVAAELTTPAEIAAKTLATPSYNQPQKTNGKAKIIR